MGYKVIFGDRKGSSGSTPKTFRSRKTANKAIRLARKQVWGKGRPYSVVKWS